MIEKKIISCDTYWYERIGRLNEFKKINDLTVISLDSKNKPLSYFHNDVWDLSSYSISVHGTDNILNFSLIHYEIRRDTKIIMYMILMYAKSRFGRQLEAKTIRNSYWLSSMLSIARWVKKENINLKEFFSDEHINSRYIKEKIIKNSSFFNLHSYFKLLLNINHKDFTFTININSEAMFYLAESIRIKGKSNKQTAPIPSRILSNSIKCRWQHIDLIVNHIEDIAKFIEFYIHKKAKYSEPEEEFVFAMKKYKLSEIFNKYGITNRIHFSTFVVMLQSTCKNLIHTYSGMRSTEVYSLTIDSFIAESDKSLLMGYTSKLEGRSKRVSWVTSSKIRLVFKILKKLNISMLAKKYSTFKEEIPLFLSVIVFKSTVLEKMPIPYLHLNNELEINSEDIAIVKKDIQELQDIDPFRDWHLEENFKIGKKWHFASHQYRRSLAIYSIKSGLVNIGVLQIQMKHLFKDMSLYYANGASGSKNITETYSDELIQSLESTKPEIKTLEYIRNVIFSDTELFGAHGKLIEKSRDRTLDFKMFILEDKNKTLKLFKNGDMAYKETAIGGCVSNEPCNSYLLNSLSECFTCNQSIIKQEKVHYVISKEVALLKQFDKGTIEYKTIEKEIDILTNYNNKLQGK
jgi:hypothetical protein